MGGFLEATRATLDAQLEEARAAARLARKQAAEQARADYLGKINELAESIMQDLRIITVRDTDEMFVRKNGVFKPALSFVNEEVEARLNEKATPSVKNLVLSHIEDKKRAFLKEFDKDLDIINFPNGIFRISTQTLEKHPDDFLSFVQLPYEYDATATAEPFDKFLDEVLYPEEKEAMLDALAYTFYREHIADILNVLHGTGANGKSVIAYVLEKLHGSDLISNESWNSIITDRFSKANLEGKNVNFTSETRKLTLQDTSAIKEITDNREQTVQRKNVQAYKTRLWAKMWTATNQFPELDDDSDGMVRRINLFDFPNQFEGEKEDPDLKYKLTTPAMLAGIFNTLAPRIKRIAETKKLVLAQRSIAERRRKMKLAKNPMHAFEDDCLITLSNDDKDNPQVTEETTATKDAVYSAFLEWCTANKVPKKSEDAFGRAMKNELNVRDMRIGPRNNRVWVWMGVKLNAFQSCDAS